MFQWLGKWSGRNKVNVESRLSEQEAIEIALEAAPEHAVLLTVATLRVTSDALIWDVGLPGKGYNFRVAIDDSNGEVIGTRKFGTR